MHVHVYECAGACTVRYVCILLWNVSDVRLSIVCCGSLFHSLIVRGK